MTALAATLALATSACAAPRPQGNVCVDPRAAGAELLAEVDLRAGEERRLSLRPEPGGPGGAKAPARLYVTRTADRKSETLHLCAGEPPAEVWREDMTGVGSDRRRFLSSALVLRPGPDGWVELGLRQTVLPGPKDRDQRPGPPIELVFRRGADGRYERAS